MDRAPPGAVRWLGRHGRTPRVRRAQVLHPVPDDHDARRRPLRWTDVCAATGRQPHALMQWHAIAGVVETRTRRTVARTMAWPGGEPDVGNLERDTLLALCRVLTSHTAPDQDCFLALWEGFGWIHGSPAVAMLGSSTPIPPAFPPAVLNGPRLRHPNRDYLLFSGPLLAATEIGDPNVIRPQSPNLFWPADRAWCVATEIDFDSTIVAGSSELIAAVLAEPALEAWPVDPDDSLGRDGDTLNT